MRCGPCGKRLRLGTPITTLHNQQQQQHLQQLLPCDAISPLVIGPASIPRHSAHQPLHTVRAMSPSFDERIQEAWDRGICSAEVVYSRATSGYETHNGIPVEARYLPCLDRKPSSRTPSPEPEGEAGEDVSPPDDATPPRKTSTATSDPFAAPRDNVVLEMDEYTVVLNKYALEPGHFLVVTNEFYPQQGKLRKQDLDMMYDTLRLSRTRHYCFFNGGPLAGASQEHRHCQFLPVPRLEAPCWPDQIDASHAPNTAQPWQSHPSINAHHFFRRITSRDALVRDFEMLHKAAQEAIGTQDDHMPYNFLMTPEYMLLFPRRNEEWDEHEIGVGGTCLIGSIMVCKESDVGIVKKAGLNRILEYVGFPISRQ